VVSWPGRSTLANMSPCLIGMEACVGAHHLSRKLKALGHDARLMPARYMRPYSKGQKNDFRDAEAIAEAVQRPTRKFVATKTADQLDLQALHRVRERLVSQRTGIINQIRAFLLERGIAVRQGRREVAAGGILRECGHGPEHKREDRHYREGAGLVPLNDQGMAIPPSTCQHFFVPCICPVSPLTKP
jgi:transposase